MGAGAATVAPSFVAYYRVSSDQQGRSGLGLEAQKAAVTQHIATVGGRLAGEFEEIESGKRSDRPQLAAALSACRARRATLVVAKLDRLARNTAFLLSIADGSGEGGVVFCDLPQIPPGPMGKFFVTLMAAVAELEAGLISQRTKAALEQARRRGVRLGNPRILAGSRAAGRSGRQAQSERSQRRADDAIRFIRDAERVGCVSLRQIAAKLTEWSVAPPSGGDRWHPQQVRRAIERAGDRTSG